MTGIALVRWGLVLLLANAVVSPAIAQEIVTKFTTPSSVADTRLVIRSTTDTVIFTPLLKAFVARYPNVELQYEQWGSNDLYNDSRRVCDGQGASADVVISSGVHQMVDLVNRACANAYRSALTAQLPAQRMWRDELWGITREAAVIIYNKSLVFADDVPLTRFALLDLMRRSPDDYRGKIATYDIEASGLGFLFAFMDSQQATTFGGLLEAFARVDAVATCCSAEIIASVESGRYKIAYNVLGSYVSTVPHANIGVIHPQDYTMFLSRALMIPKAAPQKETAAAFLDFLLSAEGRALLAGAELIQQSDNDETARSNSTDRYIPIDPTLLVAMDHHRRNRFFAEWRDSFSIQTR
ncbi:iron(III) transport system substrate-binding protein [Thalassovita litoralis]|jgi:ABC-type Fe3+ transport system substrate-binding protein|uniref:Iron(III) transport system substrate-binding protein n=1 Tax=Thalassovita litoralis TaxID=1010611 RepID=A0A521FMW7_9RHOB|nr:extracellular solute-binding protein [Thalassovita litoralis]SMO97555.1 iron(III) transport system substrate-binding protein [Thalassovita litoralis]